MEVKYISVIGLDGAGKTQIMSVIESFFKGKGVDVVSVSEPGVTDVGFKCREMLKDVNTVLSKESELLVFYVARMSLLEELVVPSINEGSVVLSDRSYVCSNAMQGALGVSPRLLSVLADECLVIKPDLYIYLDVPPEVGLSRVDSRGQKDLFEKRGLSYYNQVRKNYQDFVSETDSAYTFDANQPQEKVAQDVLNFLRSI